MNLFTQSSKRISSCNVRTLGSLSDQSEQLVATMHLCARVCRMYLHVYLFECLFVCVLGLRMFMCACGCIYMFLLVPVYTQCRSKGLGVHSCSHSQDAGVTCSSDSGK